MRIQFHRRGTAIHLGTAAALVVVSFIGCAQVLDIQQWEDPPGSTGNDGGDTDDAAPKPCELSEGGATCHDCLMNGLETDVDCGGDSCGPCPLGKACMNNADCMTKSCIGNVCDKAPTVVPCMPAEVDGDATCHDCLKNGPETDVDCGGDTCAPCADGKDCLNDGDCMSAKCVQVENGRATCSS